MKPHQPSAQDYSRKLTGRIRLIAYVAAIALPLMIILGWFLEQPSVPRHWIGRVIAVLFALYTIPAVQLTLRFQFRMPPIVAMTLSFGFPGVIAWLYLFRWLC